MAPEGPEDMFPLWHSDGEFSVIDDVIDDDTDDVTDSNDQAVHSDQKDNNNNNDQKDNSNDQKDNNNDQKDNNNDQKDNVNDQKDNSNDNNALEQGQGGQDSLNHGDIGNASANGNGNIKQEQVSWWEKPYMQP